VLNTICSSSTTCTPERWALLHQVGTSRHTVDFFPHLHYVSVLAAIFKAPPEAAQASTIQHFQFSNFNLHRDGFPCFYVLIVTKIACKSLYIVTFLNFELKQKCVVMVYTVIVIPVM
jgi:hypothetical protein